MKKFTYESILSNDDIRQAFIDQYQRFISLSKKHGFMEQYLDHQRNLRRIQAELEYL